MERLEETVRVGECLMLELRLRDGIHHERLEALLGASDPDGRRRESIERALRSGLLERSGDAIRLSDRGILLADSLLSELI